MAVNTTPIFTDTARADAIAIATANSARDGTGTVGTVFAAGADGSRIDSVTVVATGTTTAGVVRLFIHNGTAYFLWKEILVSAITPSTTVEVFRSVFIPDVPLVLPTGYSLRASTHVAENFCVHVSGGDW